MKTLIRIQLVAGLAIASAFASSITSCAKHSSAPSSSESATTSGSPQDGAIAPPTIPPEASPQPTPAPVAGSTDLCQDAERNAEREEVCRLVNTARAEQGLQPLRLDPLLTAVAQGYAQKMSSEGFFSHTAPDGSTMTSRLREGGASFSYAGENIAHGQSSPSDVMDAWMNSSGHRANILNSHYREIGIGAAQKYWVQDFTD